MAQFRKNVLSQYLRTKCDKQLRLSLYQSNELKARGWPVPLEARPAVQILRDRGKEWEQAKMQDLESAFGARVRGDKNKGRFVTTDLAAILKSTPASPTIAVQARFNHDELRSAFLTNIGMTPLEVAAIPPFGAFEPDIVLIRTPTDEEPEIMPDGDVAAIRPGDRRQALVVADIKHAGEANSSYSAEVALYAALLANWLRLNGLEDRFFVADRLGLWTRAKEISALSELIADQPGASLSDRMQAFLKDLERVDFPIFFQAVTAVYKNLQSTSVLANSPLLLSVGLGATHVFGPSDYWGDSGFTALTLLDKIGLAFVKYNGTDWRFQTGIFVGGFLDALITVANGSGRKYWLAGYSLGVPRMFGIDLGLEAHVAATLPFAFNAANQYGVALGGALVVPLDSIIQ
jgi:hypothetical protein